MKKFSVLCSAFALSTGVHASCGAAVCTLLNDRFALGTWEHVGWSADVRLESVTQGRLRSGTKTLARAFDMHWSLALRVPLVRRDHLHDLLDADAGTVGPAEQ